MLGQSRYSSYSAKTQQSKEELLVSDCSWEQSESRYTAPPPPPYTDAHSSRRTKLNVPGYLGLGDALAISPHHPGPFPSNFSVSPAESDSEQEVVNSTQDRWVFDAGSDSEQWKCHRSTSSTSCGSAGESTKCSVRTRLTRLTRWIQEQMQGFGHRWVQLDTLTCVLHRVNLRANTTARMGLHALAVTSAFGPVPSTGSVLARTGPWK